jgi:hypothetical protein
VEAVRAVANAFGTLHGMHHPAAASVLARVEAADRASDMVALISVAQERVEREPAGPQRVAALHALLDHCHHALGLIRQMHDLTA